MKLNDILAKHGMIKKGGAAEKFDDMTSAPGPKTLMYGDMNAGFFGVVPNSEFMPIGDIILELGSTIGTQRNEDTDWFKFASEGKILFRAVKPIKRHSPERAGGTLQKDWTGGKTLEFDGNLYKSRFMKGIQDDSDQREVDQETKSFQVRFNDTEFTKLMLPLFENARNNEFIRVARNRYIMEEGTDFWPTKGGEGLNTLDIGVSNASGQAINSEFFSHKNLRLSRRYGGSGWVTDVTLYNTYTIDGREIFPYITQTGSLYAGWGWWITLELVEEEV